MIKLQEVVIKIFLGRLYSGKIYRTRACFGKIVQSNPMTLRELMQATEVYISGLRTFVVKEYPNSALQSMIQHVADNTKRVQEEINDYSIYVPLEFSIKGFSSESSNSEKFEKLLCNIIVLYLGYEKIKMNPRGLDVNSFLGKLRILRDKIYDVLNDVLTLVLVMLHLDKKRDGSRYSEKITRFTQAHHFFKAIVDSTQNIEKRLAKHLCCSPYVLYQASKQGSAEDDFFKAPLDIQAAVKKVLDPRNEWRVQPPPSTDEVCRLQV